MANEFADCRVGCDVLDASTPDALALNLTQRYTLKSIVPGKAHGTVKTVNSKITLRKNAQGLIVSDVFRETCHSILATNTRDQTVATASTLLIADAQTQHDEEWDHQPNKTGEDGFWGKVQEARKKLDAKIIEAGVSSDPSTA